MIALTRAHPTGCPHFPGVCSSAVLLIYADVDAAPPIAGVDRCGVIRPYPPSVDIATDNMYRVIMSTPGGATSPRYVGAAELLALLGVGRTRLATLTGQPDFPKAAIVLRMGSIWTLEEVIAWADRKGRTLNLTCLAVDVQAGGDPSPQKGE